MKIVVYDQLTEILENEWRELWKNSEFGNFTNSPDWFIAARDTYSYQDKRIVALYTDNQLIGIGAFVKETIAGIPVWTVPAREFAGNEPVLINYSEKYDVLFYFSELAKLGNFYLTNYQHTSMKFLQQLPQSIPFHQDINHLIEFSYGPFGNLSKRRVHHIENRLATNNLTWRIDSDVQEKENALDAIFSIEKDSSKLKNGKAALDNALSQKLYRNLLMQSPGNFIISLLWIDNQPIAYSICFKSKDKIQGSQKAHIASYSFYSPGRLLIANICTYLREKNVPYFDFGRGDDDFKKSFSTKENSFYAIIISSNVFVRLYLQTLLVNRKYIYEHIVEHKNVYRVYKALIW